MMWKFGVAKDYPNVAHFIARELFQHGRLRQGWGAGGLDLRLGEFQWKINFVQYRRICHDEPAHDVNRRWTILSRMLEMRVEHVVFIGKFSTQGHDEDRFTVAIVNDPYYFENGENGGWAEDDDYRNCCCRDFRHVIPITRVETYLYGDHTLERGVFGAPLMDAVKQIEPHYWCYTFFKNFLANNYV